MRFARRPQGTGSVYKRNDRPRRRPWMAVITYGLKEGGVANRTYIGSFATKREAMDALEMYRLSKDPQTSGKITLGQIWDQVVLERKTADNPVSKNCIFTYNKHVSKLSKLPISDIRTLHLQSVVDRSGLSGKSSKQIATVYHMIFDYALANDLASKDYSRYVKYKRPEKSTMHRPFTTSEMRWLWSNADNDIVKIIIIQCYTGTRPGELNTILMENVHMDDGYMIGGIKTAAGKNRVIPIAQCIRPLVQYFYNLSLFAHSQHLLTPDPKRGLLSLHGLVNMTKLYKALDALGIKDHRPHDARHTFVTLADNYGMPSTIQKIIVGHAMGNDVTKDVYTHKQRDQLISAVEILPYGPHMLMHPDEKPDDKKSKVVV